MKVLEDLGSLPQKKKLFFASDFHLGVNGKDTTHQRELRIVHWLDTVTPEAHAIFLLGDIFDFWFEYRKVIPKGFIRLQGKLAELTDAGMPVFLFSGNHDMWMFDYFPSELGIPVYHEPRSVNINGHRLYIGHGDGLGPGDDSYKVLKKIFRNRLSQWFFRWLHPDLGVRMAHGWSRRSRLSNQAEGEEYREEDEWLLTFCRQMEETTHHDYYVFGHRHLPLDIEVNEKSRYVNLGEWVNHYTYGVYDGDSLSLEVFND